MTKVGTETVTAWKWAEHVLGVGAGGSHGPYTQVGQALASLCATHDTPVQTIRPVPRPRPATCLGTYLPRDTCISRPLDEVLAKPAQNGDAYECFCTMSELEAIRQESQRKGMGHVYDGRCRHLTEEERARRKKAGEKHVVRFKVKQLIPFPSHDAAVRADAGQGSGAESAVAARYDLWRSTASGA